MDPRALIVHLETPYGKYEPTFGSVQEILVAGLSWETEYWVSLAVAWLEQGAPCNSEIAVLLDRISQMRHFSQRVRHRAFALARRWQRQQTNSA